MYTGPIKPPPPKKKPKKKKKKKNPNKQSKMAAPADDWLKQFQTSLLKTAKRNSTKLDRKQDLNILCQVCVFFWPIEKNKMAALVSGWQRHFRLLLWHSLTEFNETWQEARSQCPLPNLCFSGWSKKQDGRPGLWLEDTFSTSPPTPLNGIQRNLTGSKISTSSTKFVFFWPIEKTRWPP